MFKNILQKIQFGSPQRKKMKQILVQILSFIEKLYFRWVVPYLNKQCNMHDVGVFYFEVCELETM